MHIKLLFNAHKFVYLMRMKGSISLLRSFNITKEIFQHQY